MSIKDALNLLDRSKYDDALLSIETEVTNSLILAIQSYCYEGKGDNQTALDKAIAAMQNAQTPLEEFSSKVARINAWYRLGEYQKIKEQIGDLNSYLKPKNRVKSDFLYWEAKYYFLLGQLFHTLGDLQIAHDYYVRSYEINYVTENHPALAFDHLNLGEIKIDNNMLNDALSNLYEAMQLSISVQNSAITAYSLYNIGIIKQKSGNYQRAMEFFKKSIEYFEKIDKTNGVILNHNMIGSLYMIRGLYSDAKHHFLQSIELSRKMKSQLYIAMSYSNMGLVFLREHDYKKGIAYLKKTLNIWRRIGNPIEIGNSLYLLIRAYQQSNDISKAKDYLGKLKELLNDTDDVLLQQKYKFLYAMDLKNMARLKYKVEAQEILEGLLKENIIEYELKLKVLINLIELKIFELSSFDDENIINEITPYLKEIDGIAEKQKFYTLKIEINILRSKLALIDYDYKKATNLLEKSSILAEQIDDSFLKNKVKIITKEYYDEIEKWKNLADKNISLREKIEQSKITDYLKDVEKLIKES